MQEWLAHVEIVALIQNWALWRDTGDWDKLRTTVHPDATMTATWFHGRFDEFIERLGAHKRIEAAVQCPCGILGPFLGGRVAKLVSGPGEMPAIGN